MKALVKSKSTTGLWLENVDKPQINDNEVLIKIKKTAVCGTDLHIYNWDNWAQQNIPVPMVVGHEFVGTITDLGKLVTGFKIGDRVSGEGHLVCETCRNCRAGLKHLCPNTKGIGVNVAGAFAEYLALPATNVFPLPSIITDDIASMFDPFGNAVHTALSFDCSGEDVLITGAGPIGIMCAHIVRHLGARHVVITDVNPHRLELAKQVKGITCVDVKTTKISAVMQQLGMLEGFDVGLEISGNETAFNDMIDVMLNGGKIAMLGLYNGDIKMDMNKAIFKGLDFKGIYGRKMYETWYKMVTLIQSGLDVSAIITHEFSYNDFNEAFATMNAGKCGKVILNWE
ncbi:MAG: L-threonine 3-dehydrogenase [Legionellales bacterium]|jgi:threonine 3-dehydrogenase|nr:L-threonine 3-dehydrogenase [Legionellales bacterium]